MASFESSVVINRPVEEVFEFISKPENELQWASGLVESKFTSEGPPGVGTTGRRVQKFLGREIASDWEFTEYEANRKVAVKTTAGPVPFEGIYTFEASGVGTKIMFQGVAEIGGFFKLAEPIVTRMLKRQIETDSANLKDLLEAQD